MAQLLPEKFENRANFAPLLVGTEVSAKYKGAFCEAKVRKVVRNIKCKVAYKQGLGSGTVQDDIIKGQIRMGATVEVKHPERKEFVEATITKIQDCSQYTVVFDDGDITTLRRTALCLKSGRHFNEMTLDELPLTNPEHFGNPVVGGRRGRRSGRHLQDDSSEEEDEEPRVKKKVQEKEANIGKVICVEMSETKKKSSKESWFPGECYKTAFPIKTSNSFLHSFFQHWWSHQRHKKLSRSKSRMNISSGPSKTADITLSLKRKLKISLESLPIQKKVLAWPQHWSFWTRTNFLHTGTVTSYLGQLMGLVTQIPTTKVTVRPMSHLRKRIILSRSCTNSWTIVVRL